MTTLIRKTIHWIGYTIATVIILAATAVSATQLLSPYLNDHRADFAKWASELLNLPITINQVTITWRRIEPEIVLKQVSILNKQTHQPTFEIQKIKINLRILQSLLHRKLLVEDFRIYGVQMTIHQKKSGQFNVVGLDNFVISDNFTGSGVAGSAMSNWIFSQPHLALRNIDISFVPEQGKPRSLSLASLNLKNTTTDHTLSARLTLNQLEPTQVEMRLEWEGETADILHSATQTHLYLYVKNLSLSEWLSQKNWKNLQINNGIANGKIWLDWDHNQLQKMQTECQLYKLQATSLITKQMMSIPRLSGHFVWHRKADRQLITGNDVLLDLPNHLWPATQFSLVLTQAEIPKPPYKLQPSSYELQTNYLDLADAFQFASASDLLPTSAEKILQDLNPKGELRNLNLQSADDSFSPLTTLYTTDFSHLSLNAVNTLPGVNNLDGKISWNGEQGNLTLAGKKTTLSYNSLFETPLSFDELTGNMTWQQNPKNTWLITADHVSAKNEDLSFNANLKLVLPQNASPTIDLNADFAMSHVAQITRYLPLKKFEPALVKWLQNRFQAGQLASGKVLIQGKLSDLSSENNSAKFLISTQVKDLQFEYAPGWPIVNHVNGDLVFSGHSMTADMTSGQLYNVPLTKVHAHFPYLGPDHPQILDLDAVVNADLAHGLRFIHESPLNNTIGKDLAGMDLTGAMQLKLSMKIPVIAPEKSSVVGEMAVTNAELSLPSWHLMLDHLTGALHFTENSIQINPMPGRLFNEPVEFAINTVQKPYAPPIVKATLQGNISQMLLDKWLNISTSTFIKGSTPYSVELDIISHKYTQPSELIIRSNLTGLAVNLPGIYGKTAVESRDFQLTADIKSGQPFQTKIQYGDLLTAAMTLNPTAQGWQFQGGELRLGNVGQANWQTQPGILVTGQINNLDWNMWHTYFSSLSMTDKNKKADTLAWMSYLRGVDISTNQFPILGQNLTQVRLQVTPDKNNWNIGVTSNQATGQIQIPFKTNGSQIKANFQHLLLTSSENQQSIDPKTIPAFSFESDDVRYNNQDIGHVMLKGQPTISGLKLSNLTIFTDVFNLTANGDWTVQKNKQQTHLSGTLKTKNVSQLLEHWNLASANLVANEGEINFNLNWSDTPYKPAINTLSGSLFLKLGKGRVINLGNSTDAKLGFGRMLNILNLQTLPRRLSLDFTDVFEKGYSFDTMQGHFDLDKGNATTEDTYFAGPIARIEIQGRIGFAAKDYDLRLDVTPYVTGSIPLVATLAGGPLVGAVSWVVEKAASGVVSKAATYHYSVTGPWDHPEWVQNH